MEGVAEKAAQGWFAACKLEVTVGDAVQHNQEPQRALQTPGYTSHMPGILLDAGDLIIKQNKIIPPALGACNLMEKTHVGFFVVVVWFFYS